MIDEQGCNGIGHHQLCCPPGADVPQCGWYYHNNGKCGGSKCPVGMFEIGSNNMYCRKSYQPACCFGTATSMHLHDSCSWSADFPGCDSGVCVDDHVEFARSMTGSGGAFCEEKRNQDPFSNAKAPREERKYCCRDDLPDQKWSECEWSSHLGLLPQDWANSKGYCLSGCPDDKVRVAMDHNTKECTRGARSKCCTPAYSTVTKETPKEDDDLNYALNIFLDNPVCTNETQSYRYESQEIAISRLSKILYTSVSTGTVNTWDKRVGAKYEYLKYKSIRSWAQTDDYALEIGSEKLPESIVCQLSYYNDWIGDEDDGLTCYAGTSDISKRSLDGSLDSLLYSRYRERQDVSSTSPCDLQKRDTRTNRYVYSPFLGRTVELITFTLSVRCLPFHPAVILLSFLTLPTG